MVPFCRGKDMGLKERQICIVGGGIGGLSAALALTQRGARVAVLEQAPEIREVGAGIQISPNGFAVIRALGLAGEFSARTIRGREVLLRDGATGRNVFRLDLNRAGPGQRYSFVHRADMVEMLAGAARKAGVRIRLLQQVTSVDLGGAKPVLKTALGASYTPDILIGADGLHSQVRRAINGAAEPFFTNQVAWRALVPMQSPPAPCATVFMGPGRHLVAYPLRDGAVMNIVAVQEREKWAEEGWFHQDDPENLRAAFAGFCPEVQRLLAHVEDVHLWGLFRHPVAKLWHRKRAAILGDAAHPTLPFLAQGANMALEDAWVLADSMDRSDSLQAAFADYQQRRRERVVHVIDAATRNARNYHMRASPLRFAAHGALRLGGALVPNMALKKFDWLYGHDVTQVELP